MGAMKRLMIVVMGMHPYLMAVAHPVVMVPDVVAPIDPIGLRRSESGK